MITLEFNVDKQTLTRTDNEKVVSNSSNVHQCHFSFSEDWDNKEITATFCRDRITVTVILDENNTCLIPSRLLKTSKDMNLEVGVFGVDEEEVITSTVVNIPVIAGSSTSGATLEITYNLFEQVMQKIDQVKKGEVEPELIFEAVNDYLTEHPFDDVIVSNISDYVIEHIADFKGEKGEQGEKGNDGKTAYQIAVDNGFSGTEEQWLASLKGDIEGVIDHDYYIHSGAYAFTYGSGTIVKNDDRSIDFTPSNSANASGIGFYIRIDKTKNNHFDFVVKNAVPTSGTFTYILMASIGGQYVALTQWSNESITNEISVSYDLLKTTIDEMGMEDIVRIAFITKSLDSYTISLENTYTYDVSLAKVVQGERELERPLKGKKVIFLGDSITAFIGINSWTDRFIENTGVEKIVNVAVAGAVMSDFSDTTLDGAPITNSHNNTLSNQVQKILNSNYDAPDLIIIAIGANGGISATNEEILASYMANNNVIALEDIDRTTCAGAFRFCNEHLHLLYPKAKICWCNPIHSAWNYRSIADTITWGENLKKLTAYGSSYNIETNRCGIYPANETSGANGEYLQDGLHPNKNGAYKIANYNENAISKLFVFSDFETGTEF